MSQFLINSNNIRANKIYINKNDSDFHHIFNVSRVKLNETIKLLDDVENQYLASVLELNEEYAILEILKKEENVEKKIFTLYQCLPKQNKMDTIIEKAVELGINKIVPVISHNTIVRIDEEYFLHKIERWEKIILASVKQSESKIIPSIKKPIRFENIFKNTSENSINLIGYEKGKSSLKQIILSHNKSFEKINLIVGPEGGFTDEEINIAQENYFQEFRLKGNILKSETAPIVLTSIIKYELGLL